MSSNSRRRFIKKTAMAVGCISQFGLYQQGVWASSYNKLPESLEVNIFSKHLQFLDYEALGGKANELGFSGVDLTVRAKGHVLPKSVKNDLPKAIEGIKRGGSTCNMITTSVESIENQLDIDVLEAASKCGVTYYRTNWFKYSENQSMEDSIMGYNGQVRSLAIMNKELGLVGCYQNHAGMHIGASFWEIHQLVKDADPAGFGVQYDIRHAMVEGANSWKNGLRLLRPFIKTIVLKDFKWKKINGTWQVINVPIGQGLVDFDGYFKLLKKYKLAPPVSLHLEYDLGGAEKGLRNISVDRQVVYNAIKKDLTKVQELWRLA